jgi:hypothetical protein
MGKTLTIQELQLQRRWVNWKLQKVPGKDRLTKVPYQPNGRKASDTNPTTWSSYEQCTAVAAQFSGVGIVLGDGVWGVDLDECCDAATGRFTPESREIVIALDSYSEVSPSGTGCHILGLGTIPGPGTKKPAPGCKFVEIYDKARYFTFTGRHIGKTPNDLLNRQTQIESLYRRVSKGAGVVVQVRPDEDARFQKLWAGDTSDYRGDASSADLALCGILARRFNNDPFKIDEEFRKSGLYRTKWEREDYRVRTILKAIGAGHAPLPPSEEETLAERLSEDGETEFVIEARNEPGYEGWFPVGEVSLVGGSSGVGKTSLLIPVLEKARLGSEVFGHTTKPREYRVLLHDRSRKAMRRTAKALGLSQDVIERVVRLNAAQQGQNAGEVLQDLITANPGAQVWLVEGLDMWVKNPNDLDEVSRTMDSLQRVATRNNVAVVGTLGSPKRKPGEQYQQHRDSLYGSIAWGRKAETVILMELHNPEEPDSVRRCTILTRCGKSEQFYFEFRPNEGLCMTTKPNPIRKDTAFTKIEDAVFRAYKPGDAIEYQPSFGHKTTFYDWRKAAILEGKIVVNNTKIYVPFVKAGDACPLCQQRAVAVQ